jgi:hypothetical protein
MASIEVSDERQDSENDRILRHENNREKSDQGTAGKNREAPFQRMPPERPADSRKQDEGAADALLPRLGTC